MPDLTGRMARCMCGKQKPSSLDLAFFEYRGPGSRNAVHSCICGYYDVAHDLLAADPVKYRHVRAVKCGGTFAPRGDVGTDSFYCGCRGWD